MCAVCSPRGRRRISVTSNILFTVALSSLFLLAHPKKPTDLVAHPLSFRLLRERHLLNTALRQMKRELACGSALTQNGHYFVNGNFGIERRFSHEKICVRLYHFVFIHLTTPSE